MVSNSFLKDCEKHLATTVIYLQSICDNFTDADCKNCPLSIINPKLKKGNDCAIDNVEKMVLMIHNEIERRKELKK